MSNLGAVEIKAFVPARDFALSKRFYEDLGFTISWSDSDLAYLHCEVRAEPPDDRPWGSKTGIPF